ncbi:TIGR03085 family metal-binding protein [Nocardioides caricicola]|uniref:TIGR03085 family metal-binding protein n=1 Tax=Nocardioides caricicola TaxID=634770 RepID=A0ABW0MZB4_9ACTN
MTAPTQESLAKRERRELCDLALALGPDAPTLCEGWTASDLMAHLVVRERKPVASIGNVVERFSGLNQRAMAKQQARGFEVLVERYRTPALFLRAVPPVDEAMNGFELLVHHEDLRRGAASWEPRDLDPAELDLLWSRLSKGMKFFGRRIPVPTVLRRSDTGATTVAKPGDDPVTVSGPVVELVLLLFGRSALRDVTFEGPEDKVEELRSAELGV